MRKVGIWIDHRKAVVVIIEEGHESQETIESDIDELEGPPGSRRASTPYAPQVENLDRRREEKVRHHLATFYKQVLKKIGRPDQLLVMGPADAKREFMALVESEPTLGRVKVKLETTDRMTDAQVAAKVRDTDI